MTKQHVMWDHAGLVLVSLNATPYVSTLQHVQGHTNVYVSPICWPTLHKTQCCARNNFGQGYNVCAWFQRQTADILCAKAETA